MTGAAAVVALVALLWSARRGEALEVGRAPTTTNQRRRARAVKSIAKTHARLVDGTDQRHTVSCCDASSDSWRDPLYRQWRAPVAVSYSDAQTECWVESQAAAAAGDYSKPASRRCALGRAHEHKRNQWAACRRECARGDGGVEVHDDDAGGVVYGNARGGWLRLSYGARGVDVEDLRADAVLATFDDWDAAEAWARKVIAAR